MLRFASPTDVRLGAFIFDVHSGELIPVTLLGGSDGMKKRVGVSIAVSNVRSTNLSVDEHIIGILGLIVTFKTNSWLC